MLQHLILFLLVVDASLACYGAYDDDTEGAPGKPGKNFTEILLKYVNKLQGGSNPAFSGFAVPDSVMKEWTDWLVEYKIFLYDIFKNKKKQMMEDTKDYYADGGPGAGIPGWPGKWKGFHKGDEGFPPQEIPPWGYKAKNLGLPTVCYLAADAGNCDTNMTARWGFNAHMQECMEFEYSGCGGNLNNFDTELACYEKCSKPVSGGCDLDTDIAVQGESVAGIPGSRRCGHVLLEKDAHGQPVVK